MNGPDAGGAAVMAFCMFGGMVFLCAGRDTLRYNKIANAWDAKFDQVLIKGHSLRGDAEFSQQLDYYERLRKKKIDWLRVKLARR